MPGFRLFDKRRHCSTDKETYLEALRALQLRAPGIFTRLGAMCATRHRRFFAQHPRDLFPRSPHLADSDSHFAQVVPGWHADTNLSNRQKERNLIYACTAAGIDYFTDLEVQFEAGHYSPLSTEESKRLSKELLRELDSA
jgi:hypothetical protein